jgi:heme A synthase
MKPHPTPPPHRIRKTIKWGGAAVTVLLVVVWIGSGWITVGYQYPRGGISVGAGLLFTADFDAPSPGRRSEFVLVTLPFDWRWWGVYFEGGDIRQIAMPIWAFAASAAAVTACAWRLDTLARRRAPLNLCPRCNYDRTGLAKDAVCPECGSKGGPA